MVDEDFFLLTRAHFGFLVLFLMSGGPLEEINVNYIPIQKVFENYFIYRRLEI